MRLHLVLLLLSSVSGDLIRELAEAPSPPIPTNPLIRPLAYDLQIQLPLSEISDPETPLFTAHCVLQFSLSSDVGPAAPFVSDSRDKGARIQFAIDGLDHFENVSLVFNGTEVDIANVVLTDDEMEITASQPILFAGRYTLSVSRYKGLIGSALYYRDAGEHAVFGSSLFPLRARAVFPSALALTAKVTMAVSIVHPVGTIALSTAPLDTTGAIDENWQTSAFRATAPMSSALLSVVLLPAEYTKVENSYTGINLAVYYNRYRVQEAQAKQLLSTSTQVVGLLKQFYSASLAMPKLDLVLMNDVTHSPSLGTIVVPEGVYLSFDYSNQIWHLAHWIGRHWVGGMVTVAKESDLCLQEDLLAYIAFKVVKRMTNDEHLRLAHYMKVILTETIFDEGASLKLTEPIDENQIHSKCGLKGVVQLESMEALLGEQTMFTAINQLVFHGGSIDSASFLGSVNHTLQDDIKAAQVLLFWRSHGGIPSLDVDRWNSSLRLRQLNGNQTILNGAKSWERMPLWPLPLQFTEFKLPLSLMLSQGIHLAPVRDGLALANLGFSHFYRVNYDIDTWKSVLEMLTQNATSYTARERAQLTTDFCYFYSLGLLPEPAASALRDGWMELLRARSASFPLCEAASFRCVAARIGKGLEDHQKRILRKRIFDALTSQSEMSCGRGLAHDVVNDICIQMYGRSCF